MRNSTRVGTLIVREEFLRARPPFGPRTLAMYKKRGVWRCYLKLWLKTLPWKRGMNLDSLAYLGECEAFLATVPDMPNYLRWARWARRRVARPQAPRGGAAK